MAEDDFVKEMERLTEEASEPKDKPRAGRATIKEKNAAKKASAPTFRTKPLKPRLESFFTGMGMLVYARDQVCGSVIAEHAPAMAEAYSSWADQSPRVRAMLERLLSGGAGTEALMSMVPVIVVVLAHHKLLPAHLLPNVIPQPEVNPNGAGGTVKSTTDTPPVP